MTMSSSCSTRSFTSVTCTRDWDRRSRLSSASSRGRTTSCCSTESSPTRMTCRASISLSSGCGTWWMNSSISIRTSADSAPRTSRKGRRATSIFLLASCMSTTPCRSSVPSTGWSASPTSTTSFVRTRRILTASGCILLSPPRSVSLTFSLSLATSASCACAEYMLAVATSTPHSSRWRTLTSRAARTLIRHQSTCVLLLATSPCTTLWDIHT
mmetsp:Transcript_1873/g.5652  ORF Transcript_1873/g.5652 Transcript_1873/m.5652 type:complete len:213 (+) Transcript_1873:385-1023(+)